MSRDIKILCAGGLGDAAMSFAKLSSCTAPFLYGKDKLKITHMVHAGTDEILSEQIGRFYESQNIEHSVTVVPSWTYWDAAIKSKDFDHILSGGWHGDKTCWEINPFPEIKYKYINGVDVVLVVASGYSGNRKFSPLDIKKFLQRNNEKKIIITGVNIRDPEYLNLQGDNRINRMDFLDYMNIICSCNTIISPNGFSCYLCGMTKKKIYYTSDGIGTDGNMHPKWNGVEIKDLDGVK